MLKERDLKFWILEERDIFTREQGGTCFYEIEKPFNLGECPAVCPKCGSISGPRVWLPPYNVRFSKPECGDLIMGVGFELIVSERFRQVYLSSGLNGLSDFHLIDNLKISGQKKKPSQVSNYYIVRPKITYTVLDEAASGLRWEKLTGCNYCRLGIRSGVKIVVVREDSWDGSDIFMATGFYSNKLVTGRFVKAIEQANLTNFVFVSADEYSEPPRQ
jgi:hypothetical protein